MAGRRYSRPSKARRAPARRRNGHKDLEFHVDLPNGETKVYKKFDQAAGMAVSIAASNGSAVNIDVITWSRAGARAYAGDYGAEVYNEDPEASVHDRIVVRADARGRIA